ncbi:macro domain-containing protein [Sphingobium sp. LMC3-1-1.1]|uniref:type II toxin-antitoxin system antitoxin DNA ADP-ribosyl glycohydrolase DarG n=1 Tax=Sphingobium sp. LMC3-1-1.1 TaxID=3135241 RepID=UPI0034980DA8
MSLTFKSGDMFAEPVQALVNTVNCVGVMGKGVALEFKQRWPENFKVYKQACDSKRLKPGTILIFDTHQLFATDGPRYLVNFPTKKHWRAKSELSYIEDGLEALVDEIRKFGITSIALPPLGCGNGGLDWADVRPLIVEKMGELEDVETIIFAPKEEADLPEYSDKAHLSMTYPRAMLLRSLAELEKFFDGAFDRISLQKIVYFLQALGVNFGLKFERNLFGPYSDVLKKALISFEKSGMISGFLTEDRRAHVTPSGVAVADDYLKYTADGADELVDQLSKLVQGYESPYGLELLSSVHWLAHHEKHFPVERIIEEMRGWNERKRNTFEENSIRAAYARLVEDGLLN